MKFRIELEVAPEEYEGACEAPSIAAGVGELVIRQSGGLLVTTRRVLLAEAIASAAREHHGCPDTGGAAIIVHAGEEV